MSTYLNHGGAEREEALAQLWTIIETRVERREAVTVAHLRPALEHTRRGWHEDEFSLVTALSGHAYNRVMVVVEKITGELDHYCTVADPSKLKELRSAYALLQTSRQLADELHQLERCDPQRWG